MNDDCAGDAFAYSARFSRTRGPISVSQYISVGNGQGVVVCEPREAALSRHVGQNLSTRGQHFFTIQKTRQVQKPILGGPFPHRISHDIAAIA